METTSLEIAGGQPEKNSPKILADGITRRVSLLDIETTLEDLLALRMEMAAEHEDTTAIDTEIDTVIGAETMKVDGIRAIVRNLEAVVAMAKDERDYQSRRVQHATDLIARIKDTAKTALEAAGKKKVEGRTGALLLKGNGGLQPLDIYDPAMVPDAYKLVSVTMPMTLWTSLLRVCRPDVRSRIVPPLVVEQVSVDGTAVREALKEPCPTCGGHPELIVKVKPDDPEGCATCGGSGFSAVPGARLLDRGQHVEIK